MRKYKYLAKDKQKLGEIIIILKISYIVNFEVM